MVVLKLMSLMLTAVPLVFTARIQLLDISPEEAQKHITQQALDLRYSQKLSEGPATGRSYNGKIIDSDDYAEEVYDANQFHGQDGLGRFIFGYGDNQQTRLEARNVNGEVRGQYRYLDPFGNDVEVQYWSDSLGFHQTDNRQQYELVPVTETPEVRRAREEHERAWREAARNNGIDVDSDTNGLYNGDDLEGELSNQNLVRFPLLPYSRHISSANADNFGSVDDDTVIVDADEAGVRSRFARQQGERVEEVTSEPRGFFYSFDYPVPFISDRRAKTFEHQHDASDVVETYARLNGEEDSGNANNKVAHTDSKPARRKLQSKAASAVPTIEDEIHDAQQSPRQKVNRSVKSAGRGSIKFKHTV